VRSAGCHRPRRRRGQEADLRAPHHRASARRAVGGLLRSRRQGGRRGREGQGVRRREGLRHRRFRDQGLPGGPQGRGHGAAGPEGLPGRDPVPLHLGGQGGGSPPCDQDRVRPDHRCRRCRGRRGGCPGDHAVGVRRELHRQRHGDQGHAHHHGEAQLGRPRGGRGRGCGGSVHADHLRCRQDDPDHRLAAAPGHRSPRADRGRDRGLGRSWHWRRLRADRAVRRLVGCRCRRLACRGRLRLDAARVPGRPDRQDGLAPALRRQRDLGRDPA
ncbi:MAG: Electron transfer flavoprotein, alpha subunit, partial [uncultured Nocardioides sp.]